MGMPRLVSKLFRGPFTVADYHRMAETGVLRPDARVELLDGLVIEMTPIGSRHAGCVKRLLRMLSRVAGDLATIGVQDPVTLDDASEPQPDVAVLRFRSDGYADRHPGCADVLLLIEVADSSKDRDRDIKIPLYARSGIPEVWLVDLEAGVVEIYRESGEEGYASPRKVFRGETLTPLLLESVALPVADILG